MNNIPTIVPKTAELSGLPIYYVCEMGLWLIPEHFTTDRGALTAPVVVVVLWQRSKMRAEKMQSDHATMDRRHRKEAVGPPPSSDSTFRAKVLANMKIVLWL